MLFLGIVLNVMCTVLSYKVLVISPYTINSFHVIEKSLVKHLLDDGHEVTYLSENIIENSTSKLKQEIYKLDKFEEISETQRTKELLKNGKVKEFLKNPENNFDVVICSWLHNNILAGISAIFHCPTIWLVSNEPRDTISELTCCHYPYLNFYQQNAWTNVFCTLCWISYFSTKNPEENTYQELFNPIAKSRGIFLENYNELMYNTSVLYLTHQMVSYNVPVPPYVKYIGGVHIDRSTLPAEEINKILDSQQYGVIYFNMGYDTKNIFSKSEIKIFMSVFQELNQTVFWQHDEVLEGLPKNVIVQKYFQHFGILDHQNTRVLITDSSVTSINEAVFHAVPVLNIATNRHTDRLTDKHISKIVYLDDKLHENLKNALVEILNNDSISYNFQDISDIYHDRVIPPSEEFKGWVNYVCKKGVKHLHTEKLNIYEIYGLDIVACFVLLVFSFIWCFKIVKNRLS